MGLWFWIKRLVVTKSKAEKDSNKPKRPLSVVLVLIFRKDSNIKHVSMVGKGGGEKWKYLE